MCSAIIGSGYVGRVSNVCFSDLGQEIIRVDKETDKTARLENGEVPILERSLDLLMERNIETGRLSFTIDLGKALQGADAVFSMAAWRDDEHANLKNFYNPVDVKSVRIDGCTELGR